MIVPLYVSATVCAGIFTFTRKSSHHLHTLPASLTAVFCLLKYVNTTSHVIQSFRVSFAQSTTFDSSTAAQLMNETAVGFSRTFSFQITLLVLSQLKSVTDNVVQYPLAAHFISSIQNELAPNPPLKIWSELLTVTTPKFLIRLPLAHVSTQIVTVPASIITKI